MEVHYILGVILGEFLNASNEMFSLSLIFILSNFAFYRIFSDSILKVTNPLLAVIITNFNLEPCCPFVCLCSTFYDILHASQFWCSQYLYISSTITPLLCTSLKIMISI
jgi:hypothetical protein